MVRKAMGIGVISALAALMVVSLAMAQPGGGGAGGGGGRGMGGGGGMGGGMGGGGRGMMDPSAQADNVLQQLNITGDAATALKPKLVKVIELQAEVATPRGGRGGMGGGRMGGGGGMGGGAAAAPENDVTKARVALQTALTASPQKTEDITKALTAYRAARQKAQAELATAQADLKKVLTPTQEAELVLRGTLD